MKKALIVSVSFALIAGMAFKAQAQTSVGAPQALTPANPWADNQLLEPALLADMLKTGGNNYPLIFNMGTVDDIKGAKHIGALSNAVNAEILKTTLHGVAKTKPIIIYCGCCPFAKCPNIRPAFLELKKLGFTNVQVLNLPVNLKTNWVNKGYPLANN